MHNHLTSMYLCKNHIGSLESSTRRRLGGRRRGWERQFESTELRVGRFEKKWVGLRRVGDWGFGKEEMGVARKRESSHAHGGLLLLFLWCMGTICLFVVVWGWSGNEDSDWETDVAVWGWSVNCEGIGAFFFGGDKKINGPELLPFCWVWGMQPCK